MHDQWHVMCCGHIGSLPPAVVQCKDMANVGEQGTVTYALLGLSCCGKTSFALWWWLGPLSFAITTFSHLCGFSLKGQQSVQLLPAFTQAHHTQHPLFIHKQHVGIVHSTLRNLGYSRVSAQKICSDHKWQLVAVFQSTLTLSIGNKKD